MASDSSPLAFELNPLPNRRDFLQTAGIFSSALLLPNVPAAAKERSDSWFHHTTTGEFWSVADPVSWVLQNAHEPLLTRAHERLVTLGRSDRQRVIRLVVRRCKLNLIEIGTENVAVHHWGPMGQTDLRPFFKTHGLAREAVKVSLIDRKKETTKCQLGDDFLFGARSAPDWPWKLYELKWRRRYVDETNDWDAAPGTRSGFGWQGLPYHCIPWAALKSCWRRNAPIECQNCDRPTRLTNFGLRRCGLCNWTSHFQYRCFNCRRLFDDRAIESSKVEKWMQTNLDTRSWPIQGRFDNPLHWTGEMETRT